MAYAIIHAKGDVNVFEKIQSLIRANGKKESDLRKQPTTDHVDDMNSLVGLFEQGILLVYPPTGRQPKKLGKESRKVFGRDVALELPSHFTEKDKISFCETRDVRRNAIHVYDGDNLRLILDDYMTKKTFKIYLEHI